MSNQIILIIVIVIVLFFGFICALFGLLGAGAVFGTRKYVAEARAAEGRQGALSLARSMVICASNEHVEAGRVEAAGLPPTSRPVPGTLAEVSGKRYMSSPSDWSDPAFACARFSMEQPQSFQYQWVASGPRAGVARAVADLDGNGKPDHQFEVDVTCPEGGAGCESGRPREVR